VEAAGQDYIYNTDLEAIRIELSQDITTLSDFGAIYVTTYM
jgi:hypothetical protein